MGKYHKGLYTTPEGKQTPHIHVIRLVHSTASSLTTPAYYYNSQHFEVPTARISKQNNLATAQGANPSAGSRVNTPPHDKVVPQLPDPHHTTRNESATPGPGYQGVFFDCVQVGYSTPGLPMGGLAGPGYNPHSCLVNPKDEVGTLLSSRGPHPPPTDSIVLRICWPGYNSLSQNEWAIRTTEYGKPITRVQLVSQICLHFRRFHTEALLQGSRQSPSGPSVLMGSPWTP